MGDKNIITYIIILCLIIIFGYYYKKGKNKLIEGQLSLQNAATASMGFSPTFGFSSSDPAHQIMYKGLDIINGDAISMFCEMRENAMGPFRSGFDAFGEGSVDFYCGHDGELCKPDTGPGLSDFLKIGFSSLLYRSKQKWKKKSFDECIKDYDKLCNGQRGCEAKRNNPKAINWGIDMLKKIKGKDNYHKYLPGMIGEYNNVYGYKCNRSDWQKSGWYTQKCNIRNPGIGYGQNGFFIEGGGAGRCMNKYSAVKAKEIKAIHGITVPTEIKNKKYLACQFLSDKKYMMNQWARDEYDKGQTNAYLKLGKQQSPFASNEDIKLWNHLKCDTVPNGGGGGWLRYLIKKKHLTCQEISDTYLGKHQSLAHEDVVKFWDTNKCKTPPPPLPPIDRLNTFPGCQWIVNNRGPSIPQYLVKQGPAGRIIKKIDSYKAPKNTHGIVKKWWELNCEKSNVKPDLRTIKNMKTTTDPKNPSKKILQDIEKKMKLPWIHNMKKLVDTDDSLDIHKGTDQEVCQKISNIYGDGGGINNEAKTLWKNKKCNTKADYNENLKNPGITCQYLSDRYGIFPGDWMGLSDKPGLRHVWLNKKCQTHPEWGKKCQIVSDHYGIHEGKTWGGAYTKTHKSPIATKNYWGIWGCRKNGGTSPTKLTGIPDYKICESIQEKYGDNLGDNIDGYRQMYHKVYEVYNKKCNKTFIPHSSLPTGTTSAPNICQKLSDDYGIIHKIGVGSAKKGDIDAYKKDKCTTKPTDICKSLTDHYGMYASGTGQGIFSPKINQLWTTNKCKDITDKSVCQKISNSVGTYSGQWANIWPGGKKRWPTHQKSANLWIKNRCNTKPWWRHPPNIQGQMGKPPDNNSICHSISNTFGASPTTWQNPDSKPHGPWTHWRKDPLPPQRVCRGWTWTGLGWRRPGCTNVTIPMKGKQNCNTSPDLEPPGY